MKVVQFSTIFRQTKNFEKNLVVYVIAVPKSMHNNICGKLIQW